jgi:lipopolysaccharide biosynthesis protein
LVWVVLKCQSAVAETIQLTSLCVEFARHTWSPARIETIVEYDNTQRSQDRPSRLCVFCHYDPSGRVSAPVQHYVQALHAAGLGVIVVSSAPHLDNNDVAKLAPHTMSILRRTNVGYDFGCYKEGVLRLGDLQDTELLLLANDSVLGPFDALDNVLSLFDATADIWALTESVEFTDHLQSYFVAFRNSALRHPAFSDFWREYLPLGSRAWAIRAGELGLSRTMRRNRLRLRALFDTRTLLENFHANPAPSKEWRRIRSLVERGARLNPTHFFWRELIELGFPFIKRDLVRSNPMQLENVHLWKTIVAERFRASANGFLDQCDNQ